MAELFGLYTIMHSLTLSVSISTLLLKYSKLLHVATLSSHIQARSINKIKKYKKKKQTAHLHTFFHFHN